MGPPVRVGKPASPCAGGVTYEDAKAGRFAPTGLREDGKILETGRAVGVRSTLTKEYGCDSCHGWEEVYLKTLHGDGAQAGFEPRTLLKASVAWEMWTRWVVDRDTHHDPFEVLPVQLAAFLTAVATKGATLVVVAYSPRELSVQVRKDRPPTRGNDCGEVQDASCGVNFPPEGPSDAGSVRDTSRDPVRATSPGGRSVRQPYH